MSLTQRARELTEQLAPSRDDVDEEEPDPRGEHRVHRKDREEGGLITYLLGHRTPSPSTDAVDTLERMPPEKIDEYWQGRPRRSTSTGRSTTSRSLSPGRR